MTLDCSVVCCAVFNFYMLILELKVSSDAVTLKNPTEMCLFSAPFKQRGAGVSAAMREMLLWFPFSYRLIEEDALGGQLCFCREDLFLLT